MAVSIFRLFTNFVFEFLDPAITFLSIINCQYNSGTQEEWFGLLFWVKHVVQNNTAACHVDVDG